MKRTFPVALCSLLILAGGAMLHAQSGSTLTVKPSEMRDGETKTITDDGTSITVKREGDTTHVRIENAEKTQELTITRDGNRIRVGRTGSDGSRSLVIGPNRERITIDGLPLDELEKLPRFRSTLPRRGMQTFFICPTDKTTLRVPQDKANETYHCPVDGTPMEKRKGHGIQLFFDDSSIEL